MSESFEKAQKLADNVRLLEEYFFQEIKAGRLKLENKILEKKKVLLHGHCHQKAFDALSFSVKLLESVEGIEVETISSSCCGMAGAFGYQSENYDVSMKMAELSLLPRIRKAGGDAIVSACGTSCRQQIKHGTGRSVEHPISILRKMCID